MALVFIILLYALQIFWFLLLARIVVEMISSFSRSFRPPRWLAVIFEVIFTITDPPVKALRRIVPPLRLGNVALDTSVLVLFFIIIVLQWMLRVGYTMVM